MRVVIFLLAFSANISLASSKNLLLAGVVPLRAEVIVEASKRGVTRVVSKSSPELKIEVRKRSPASVVQVSAP